MSFNVPMGGNVQQKNWSFFLTKYMNISKWSKMCRARPWVRGHQFPQLVFPNWDIPPPQNHIFLYLLGILERNVQQNLIIILLTKKYLQTSTLWRMAHGGWGTSRYNLIYLTTKYLKIVQIDGGCAHGGWGTSTDIFIFPHPFELFENFN